MPLPLRTPPCIIASPVAMLLAAASIPRLSQKLSVHLGGEQMSNEHGFLENELVTSIGTHTFANQAQNANLYLPTDITDVRLESWSARCAYLAVKAIAVEFIWVTLANGDSGKLPLARKVPALPTPTPARQETKRVEFLKMVIKRERYV